MIPITSSKQWSAIQSFGSEALASPYCRTNTQVGRPINFVRNYFTALTLNLT